MRSKARRGAIVVSESWVRFQMVAVVKGGEINSSKKKEQVELKSVRRSCASNWRDGGA
jgi:hypothetical protein